jgi:hypothetical protein
MLPPVRFCLAVLLVLAAFLSVQGRPPHKQAIAGHLGPFLPVQLNACTLCHLPDKPGAEGKPHNAFGARMKAVGEELARAGKPSDIASRFDAIADEDSDGDGVPNLIEILTGHAPGDPADRPTAEEIVRARQVLADYRKLRSAYPWRPHDVVKRPAPPDVKNAAWVRTPIDRFIAAEHEARGLTPRAEAGKATVLRRLYLDLTGLPPTPDELHAYLADQAPDAYEKVVDRLLASPRYGERWGRHWMDVWRYSDWAGWTDGGQIRDSHPHIWRWRDWIIESLNADKGYDTMVLEMLAGDELAPDDPDTLRATGFLVRNYKMLSREKWLEDTVEHTFLAFQATTINCARCHDHMFDPIFQKEYYQVRAIFTPHQVRIDRIPGQADTKKDGLPRAYDADLATPTFLLIRGDDRTPDKTPLAPGVPAALGGKYSVHSVSLTPGATIPDKRDFVTRETIAASAEAVRLARQARDTAPPAATISKAATWFDRVLASARTARSNEIRLLADLGLQAAEARHEALLAVLHVEQLADAGKKDSPEWKKAALDTTALQRRAALAEAKHHLKLAEAASRSAKDKPMIDAAMAKAASAKKELAAAETAMKAGPSTAYAPRSLPSYPATSSGRRLAFARWLASQQNPLTARVAVNHIWLRHFDQAIVPSVFDFGRNGRPPSHPALLDWLAAEFMNPSTPTAKPWSMKHLHRLIVTSAVYRQSSTPDEACLAIDRDNVYLWRMPPRRLEAELVRDSVLFVAGRLNLTMSGPDIDQNEGLKVFRRSLYFRHAAEKEMEFLKLFDAASVTECYQRKESIVPQQALALANSELTIRMARLLARDLNSGHAADRQFVTALFERTLSRVPTSAELAECLAFLAEQTRQFPSGAGPDDLDGRKPSSHPGLRAREGLAIVMLNHHEFVTIR